MVSLCEEVALHYSSRNAGNLHDSIGGLRCRTCVLPAWQIVNRCVTTEEGILVTSVLRLCAEVANDSSTSPESMRVRLWPPAISWLTRRGSSIFGVVPYKKRTTDNHILHCSVHESFPWTFPNQHAGWSIGDHFCTKNGVSYICVHQMHTFVAFSPSKVSEKRCKNCTIVSYKFLCPASLYRYGYLLISLSNVELKQIREYH